MPESLYIRDDRSLQGLIDRIRAARELAVDTEFLRERTYYPKLCLLQVGTHDVHALVDPFGCSDLTPLWEVLLGGATIVLHAGAQDLEIIQRITGQVPAKLLDTQIAAAFLGHGDSISYARLVEAATGESPNRSEAYTDWSRRPLTPEQQEYALDDVRYLLACADGLRADLEARGRMQWVEEEVRRLAESTCHTPDPREQWRRVSGGRKLRGGALAVLQEAAAWREQEAIDRDIPRQRVVPDRVLVEIARRAPRNVSQVERLRGLHPREAKRSTAAIVDTVRRALQRPQGEWPSWPQAASAPDEPCVEELTSLLDAVVRARGREMELSPRLLGTRADLGYLTRLELAGSVGSEDAEPVALLAGWRREIVGELLLGLLRGEVQVTVERQAGGPRLRYPSRPVT